MSEMPTLEAFMQYVGRMIAAHPDWRYGQVLFNTALGCVPSDVLEPLWSSNVDPFYDDNKADAFLSALFPVAAGVPGLPKEQQ